MRESVDWAQFPSLELGYEHVKDVLAQQAGIMESLTVKATVLWATAIGAGAFIAPLGVTRLGEHMGFYGNPVPLVLAIISFVAVTALSLWVMFPKRAYGTVHPHEVVSQFVTLPRERFMSDMLKHIERHYCKNRKTLECAGWLVRGCAAALVGELLTLTWWVFTF